MKKELLYPVSIYHYRHITINPKTGRLGSRWDYVGHEGREYPELIKTLSRTGSKIVYHGITRHPKTKKLVLALWRGEDKSKGDKGWLSQVYEPNIKRPGLGFGDLGDRADAALLFKRDEQAGTLTVMVFPGLGKEPEAAALFVQWGTGAVRECIPSNNVYLDTQTVTA